MVDLTGTHGLLTGARATRDASALCGAQCLIFVKNEKPLFQAGCILLLRQLTIDIGVLVIWGRILPRVVAVSTLSDVGGVAVVRMSAPCLTCLECTNAQQSSFDIRPIFFAAAEPRFVRRT